MFPLNVPIFQHHFLTQNQRLISSCTQRLLQLQNELQTKHLKQQLISSLTMKEFSLKKLIEEQDLLISYLKDEFRQLQARKSHTLHLEQAIISTEEKYLAMVELKSIDLTEREKYLEKLKIQYNQLHEVMGHLTKESTTLYQLKVKLTERNTLNEGILNQRIATYCDVKAEHERESNINKDMREDTNTLRNQVSKNKSINLNLGQQFTIKKSDLEENNLKLISLQKEVQKYEQARARFKEIQKAASKDNHLLKQTLKDKVETMRQRQLQLSALNQQKQALEKKKAQSNERLNNSVRQSKDSRESFAQEQQNRQLLKSRYEQVTSQRFTAEAQIQRLEQKILYLREVKRPSEDSCLQTQQALQKNLYFLDQYMLINSELIAQIQIMVNEQVSKSTIGKIHLRNNYQKDRSYQIMQLRQFLSQITQRTHITEKNVSSLVRDFNNYKIC